MRRREDSQVRNMHRDPGEDSMFRSALLLALSSLALCALPGTADAQSRPAHMRFESMDRDHNGVITQDEWQGSARSFQVHDWNGDGKLSGAEVRIGAQRHTN